VLLYRTKTIDYKSVFILMTMQCYSLAKNIRPQ